jgi:3-methyladenine DNA glycosylase AlkD
MTTATGTRPQTSTTTRLARAFVADHRDEAVALGRAAGELVGDPAAVTSCLRDGLAALADPAYLEGQDRVAHGIGPVLGVRQPLLHATAQGLRAAMREDRSSTVLDVAGQLLRADLLELRWIAFSLLERTILEDPERTWQLVRTAAGRAGDWITVDSLAHVTARGILAETYRWSELEQLVYSPSRWERRLVGSTIAIIPTVDHIAGRSPDIARRGLALVRELIGDAEPDVQKALSWAVRSMSVVDETQAVEFLSAEAAIAAATYDGHRAWVVRDSLEKLPAPIADELRGALDGVRKRPHAPTTSRAAETAAAFIGLGVDVPPTDRPIVDRP